MSKKRLTGKKLAAFNEAYQKLQSTMLTEQTAIRKTYDEQSKPFMKKADREYKPLMKKLIAIDKRLGKETDKFYQAYQKAITELITRWGEAEKALYKEHGASDADVL